MVLPQPPRKEVSEERISASSKSMTPISASRARRIQTCWVCYGGPRPWGQKAGALLTRFGSVTVLNDHIPQVKQESGAWIPQNVVVRLLVVRIT